MYCVIYGFKIKPDCQQVFRSAWHELTQKSILECGSLGARLHRSDDGMFLAYAQWPDEESWRHGHRMIEQHTAELGIDSYFEEAPAILHKLSVLDDLLEGSRKAVL